MGKQDPRRSIGTRSGKARFFPSVVVFLRILIVCTDVWGLVSPWSMRASTAKNYRGDLLGFLKKNVYIIERIQQLCHIYFQSNKFSTE